MCVFNTYVFTNVYFGCGIVKFNIKQIKELKKTHVLPMIRKLGLGDNFPRKLLNAQKSCLGIGLIESNTTIDVLAIKTCVVNERLQGKISKPITAQEELIFIDSGLTKK